MEYHFQCPKCGENMMAEVDVGEHLSDFSDECENPTCKYKFSEAEKDKIYTDSQEDCFSSMIDYAHDLLSDR